MATAKQQRQKLRALEEARDVHKFAKRVVKVWCAAVAVYVAVPVFHVVMVSFGVWPGPTLVAQVMWIGLGGMALFWSGFDTDAAWDSLGKAQRQLRQAGYDYEDALLEEGF